MSSRGCQVGSHLAEIWAERVNGTYGAMWQTVRRVTLPLPRLKDGGVLPGEMHVCMFLQTIGCVSKTKHCAVFTAERRYAGRARAALRDHMKRGNRFCFLVHLKNTPCGEFVPQIHFIGLKSI